MNFKNIIENIHSCNGGIINIIYDNRTVLDDFLICVKYKLEDYNIIDVIDENGSRLSSLEDLEDLEKIIKDKIIDGRNIIFINHSPKALYTSSSIINKVPYRKYIELINNKNITLVVLNNYYSTTNTQIQTSPLELQYTSSLIMLIKNKKLKIIKSRYIKDGDNIIFDVNSLLRKTKLETLIVN